MAYTAREASISRGVLEKMACIYGVAQSFTEGTYISQDWETSTKRTLAAMPIHTACWACFFPAISLRISVTKKVVAKRILPRVISMPKAWTKISTSMLAAMVAKTVKDMRPLVPNRKNHSSTEPYRTKRVTINSSSFLIISLLHQSLYSPTEYPPGGCPCTEGRPPAQRLPEPPNQEELGWCLEPSR